MSKDSKKVDRVEINSFSFSLFMILQKLFKEEDTLEKYAEEILNFSICHWSKIQKINEKQYIQKKNNIFKLWNENKIRVKPENIIVTPGAKMALSLALMSVLRDGDEVIMVSPVWPNIRSSVLLKKGNNNNLRKSIYKKMRKIVNNKKCRILNS